MSDKTLKRSASFSSLRSRKETEDEVDDYMNNEFIFEKEEDPRTISYERTRLRKSHCISTDTPHKPTYSSHELQKIQREKGFETEIPSSNIGFKLLEKMGYKKGMSLGTNDTNGIITPITVVVKENYKSGLGTSNQTCEEEDFSFLTNIKNTSAIVFDTNKLTPQVNAFRGHVKRRVDVDVLWRDIRALRVSIQQMDEQNDISRHYLWIDEPIISLDLTELERQVSQSIAGGLDEISPDLQLERLVRYARDTYFYCGWCGFCYNDSTDLSLNCPGTTRESHDG